MLFFIIMIQDTQKDFEKLKNLIEKEGDLNHLTWLYQEVEALTERLNTLEEFVLLKLNSTLEELVEFEQNNEQ